MHKYLDEIDIKPMTNIFPQDSRQAMWKYQTIKYGFDERDTWDLRYAFMCWLYERVRMYNDVNIVATNDEIIKINNEEQSFQIWIERLLLGLEYYFKLSDYGKDEEIKYMIEQEILHLFSDLIYYLWW